MEALEKEVRPLQQEAAKLTVVEKKVIDVNRKIMLLKKTEAEKPELLDKTKMLLERIPPGFELTDIAIRDKEARISAEANSALVLSRLIAGYFESGLVSQVSIESARLQPKDAVFVLSLGVSF